MSDRFGPFDPSALDAPARAVHDRILEERGYLPGPYQFWLAAPGFADRIERVEDFLRHDVSVSERVVEIAVLVSARHWNAGYVWSSHAPAALRCGIAADAVEAIRCRAEPPLVAEDEMSCHALCRALLAGGQVPGPLWQRARSALGEQGVNEVLGLLGLYASVCMTMTTYQMPPKADAPTLDR